MYNKTEHYTNDLKKCYIDDIQIYLPYSHLKENIYRAKKYGSTLGLQKDIQKFCQHKIDTDIVVFPGRTFFQSCKQWNPNLAKILTKRYVHTYKLQNCFALKKRFSLKGQKTQNKKGRQKTQNIFINKMLPSIKEKRVLIIDDVIASGNTANEIAKICKNNGAKSITGYFLTSSSV